MCKMVISMHNPFAEAGLLPLMNCFFLQQYHLSLRFSVSSQAREPDELIVDDLRSFLFTEDGAPSQDLISLNLLRARDMGVPTYNKARGAFGLERKGSISEISDKEQTVAHIEEAYGGDVDAVDSFIGGLAETKPEGRMFGDLFHESIKEQFVRLR